jgi:hypothetical protein
VWEWEWEWEQKTRRGEIEVEFVKLPHSPQDHVPPLQFALFMAKTKKSSAVLQVLKCLILLFSFLPYKLQHS